MTETFAGVFPAVMTPFADEKSLDLDAFGALVERLYAAGVSGLYVGGNCGEWYLQTLEERKAVARAAVDRSRGRGRVILHVGCPRMADAVELARYGESIGVDAISSLPPYVARWSGAEVVRYYERLSSVTSLPFFVYYFPALTGTAAGEAFFDAITKVPGVCGVKFTDMNLYELANLAGGKLTVLNGHDQVLYPALAMGAHGGIGSFYNVLPEEFAALFRAWQCGDAAGARAAQDRINRVIRVVKQFRLVPALKFIAGLQGVQMGVCRAPTLALSEEEQQRLRAALPELGIVAGRSACA